MMVLIMLSSVLLGFSLSYSWNQMKATREARAELDRTFEYIRTNMGWERERFSELARDPESKYMDVDEDRPV